ncbi:hypothetical protein SORBI_3002G286150 [Sorghum bicolor]|uniref:Uncharacterized protein n=1 Tax=Sorghum bicolor TaxID=4558 RepID=A0A1W0W694_SORBI|nr:hypothetical protein SORBI_3002G286150 [Sorghum bicolor]
MRVLPVSLHSDAVALPPSRTTGEQLPASYAISPYLPLSSPFSLPPSLSLLSTTSMGQELRATRRLPVSHAISPSPPSSFPHQRPPCH